MPIRSVDDALADPCVIEAIRRSILKIDAKGQRITYSLKTQQEYNWSDPEEWVRAATIAWLVVERGYPQNRMRLEVRVPRRLPNDHADIVVFRDDACRDPYLVVESKATDQSAASRKQAIEQVFGNANSLGAPFAMYDDSTVSILFDRENHPPLERQANQLGPRAALPEQYGDVPDFALVAGTGRDIAPQPTEVVESKTRRAHSEIWSGGKRDPLKSFDEWSKLLFAKVIDERWTENGKPREFQVGTRETVASVANRIHALFAKGCRQDPSIFPPGVHIELPDTKIERVVRILQDLSFTRTDVDSIGKAFEQFFSSVFRGGLGQYFTMRQLSRFVVAMLGINHRDYVLDPTAGSGGFLLEVLLQCWQQIDRDFAGRPTDRDRLKSDFAGLHVYGIELHDVVARICKINLMLHHDGHTNIEGDRSCLDARFAKDRLNPPKEKFSLLVGNPPFGTDIEGGEEDQLGTNSLENFKIAEGRESIDSEQVILERSIDFLEPGGRLGLVLPDGLLNNQGEQSNCPQTRRLLARAGFIEAIVSLPDYAFRKSGAQNKTSILFFRKFTRSEQRAFSSALSRAARDGDSPSIAIVSAITETGLEYQVFLAEANSVGYTPTGTSSTVNDLYNMAGDHLAGSHDGTILGEWLRFKAAPAKYVGRVSPDCMAVPFDKLWSAHASNRIDPKYHLFEREAARPTPNGWITEPLKNLMERRYDLITPEDEPDREYKVMTISQTGEIRERAAGKGRNPPRWIGAYFADSPGTWYAARTNDVVFSSIDLWKGCIALVPPEFGGALVSKEFPIYQVTDARLLPEFLQCLLRTRYYQRAFRAITTGHSNRRRTQEVDFEALLVSFPSSQSEQRALIARIQGARVQAREASALLKQETNRLSDVIDGRGQEELPDIGSDELVTDDSDDDDER